MAALQPSPAATVVLVRNTSSDIEVLMLLRNSNLVFNGGHWVFPGGKIDADDYVSAGATLEYHAARHAAVRETREEAGIVIDHQDLIHTAHWTTPENLPRRYSTWFFVCPLYRPVEVAVDKSEILEYQWITPANALAASDGGELKVPRPTRTTLEDLMGFSCVEDLLKGISQQGIRVFPKNSLHYSPLEMGVVSATEDPSGN